MKKVVFVFFLLASLFANAQRKKADAPTMKVDSVLPSDSLLKDLYFVKNTILQSHVGPFTFCTETEFHESFQRSATYLREKDRTYFEFACSVAQALKVMKDSHTAVEFGHLVELQLKGKKYFLPLRVTHIDGKLYIPSVRPVDAAHFPAPGSEVISINGVKAIDVYRNAFQSALTEGDALTAKYRVADVLFTIMLGQYAPLDSLNTLEIIPHGKTEAEKFQVKALDLAGYLERKKTLDTNAWEETLKLTFLNQDSLAVLKIGTFAPTNRKRFEKELRNHFILLNEKKCSRLIIDIRDNGGGSSTLVEQVFAYLREEGYNTPSNIIAKKSDLAMKRSPYLNRALGRWLMRTVYRKNEDVVAFATAAGWPKGTIDTLYFNQAVTHKKKYVYTGKCTLLINGLSASASVDFTSAFRRYNRGEILGESIMGPPSGTWGNGMLETLPFSKLKVNFSTIRYNNDTTFQYLAAPVQPDLLITPTPTDFFLKYDPVLETAKRKLLLP